LSHSSEHRPLGPRASEYCEVIDSLSITLTASNKHKRTQPDGYAPDSPMACAPLRRRPPRLACILPTFPYPVAQSARASARRRGQRHCTDGASAHTLTIHSSSPIAIRLINRQASDHPTSERIAPRIPSLRPILRLLRPAQAAGGMRVVPKMGNAEDCSGGATGARAAFGGISTSQLASVANPTKFSGSLRDFLELPSHRRHARGYYSEGRDIMDERLSTQWITDRFVTRVSYSPPSMRTDSLNPIAGPLRCLHAPPLSLWGGETMPVKYIGSGPFRHRAYVADAMQAGLPGLSNPLLTIAHRNLNVKHIVEDYISRIASNFSFD
ncbi:uncharacterized protein SCHCODRAFT_02488790, partial [Schizophyllum commune H4-8]|uniref:uncharacterized protein n=1 Tax=Schizophyllum commune (strain H4-8 / FGSC 9210) TaxID=578458 RepID=UPI00215E0DD7